MNKRIKSQMDKFAFRLIKNPLWATEGDKKYIVIALGNVVGETSDVGNAVLERFVFVDVYAGFYIDTTFQETQYSFRSTVYPTQKLAEYLRTKGASNGGGHLQSSACRFPGIMTELPLEIVSKKRITRLARGTKLDILETDPEAAILKELFPELVNLVARRFLVIRGGEVVYDQAETTDSEFAVEKDDVVIHLTVNWGKAVVMSEPKNIKNALCPHRQISHFRV